MPKNTLRDGELVVYPFDFEQLTDWMSRVLKGRSFRVISTEVEFNNEPMVSEGNRLDEGKNFQCVKFYSARMQILFCTDGTEDIFIPVGGFGKLSINFVRNGFVIENKGVGKWEFFIETTKKPEAK